MPTTGMRLKARSRSSPGSPKALMMVPAQSLGASRQQSSTSSAACASSAALTIIGGPLPAVRGRICHCAGAARWAMSAIIAVVASEALGLISRILGMEQN